MLIIKYLIKQKGLVSDCQACDGSYRYNTVIVVLGSSQAREHKICVECGQWLLPISEVRGSNPVIGKKLPILTLLNAAPNIVMNFVNVNTTWRSNFN